MQRDLKGDMTIELLDLGAGTLRPAPMPLGPSVEIMVDDATSSTGPSVSRECIGIAGTRLHGPQPDMVETSWCGIHRVFRTIDRPSGLTLPFAQVTR